MPVLAQSTQDLRQRELKDRAHQLMRKGKFDAALVIYQTLIHDHPKDGALRLHHAELCQKLSRPQAAVGSYLAAAQLFAQAGYVARAKAAVGCGLRISPKHSGLLDELASLNPKPVEKPPPPVATAPVPKLTVAWTQPLDAKAVAERAEVTAKKPEPRRAGTSHLRLVPVPEDFSDCVTEPYFPLPDWLDDDDDEPLVSGPRPPLRPGLDEHFPKRVTVSQRGPHAKKAAKA